MNKGTGTKNKQGCNYLLSDEDNVEFDVFYVTEGKLTVDDTSEKEPLLET